MLAVVRTAGTNRLLESLPRKDRLRVLAGCEEIELALSEELCKPGKPMAHVYFPTESFVSMVVPMDGRASLEVGMIGSEGMLGVSIMLGVNGTPLHGVVQGAGSTWRMSAARFRRELDRTPALRQELNRYVYVLLSQLAQTIACTRFHVVEARLARWLLMSRDRAHADEFHVTHEFLAYMLGVRRVGVTRAAGALQTRRLIRYRRGNVSIMNVRGLEAAACGYYRAGTQIYESVFG